MKKVILIAVFLIANTIIAQDQYTKGMQKAFEFWGNGNTTEAANLFERIATAEPDNWLPYYYVAQINTIISFGEKDKEVLSKQLEKAQEYTDLAKAISKNNPEILVQQALVHTAWVAFDGATYGMTLSGKVNALYAQAMKLDPKNPRVICSKAEWDMGSAKFFGKDMSPYCKDVERSIPLFDSYTSEVPFYPTWGKERAEMIVENCKKM